MEVKTETERLAAALPAVERFIHEQITVLTTDEK
jgi:hypothetical protein